MSATPVLIMDTFPDFNQRGFDVDSYNQRFYSSNVVIRAAAKNVEYPDHWGPLSVKCSLKGEEHYKSLDSRYTVDEDHFLIFNNGKTYSSWIESTSEVRSFTLNVAPGFAQSAFASICFSPDHQLENPVDCRHKEFRFTEGLYKHDGLVSPVVKKMTDRSNETLLDELFHQLMENLLLLQVTTNSKIDRVDKIKASTRIEIFERLIRARDFIHSSFSEKITLDDIASVACMNKFYFLRQFRKVFHVTPHQFLTERRLSIASNLLQTTDSTIAEVCSQVGFNDVSSFGKLYRRHYGFPPSDLRM